jgi:spoIIIJ-associated protein
MVGFMKSALGLFGLNKKEGEAPAEAIDLEAFLEELPRRMGFDVSIKKTHSDLSPWHFEVEGPESDSFLGSSTEMLDALAHVSMRVLRRNEGASNVPTAESGEGFRVSFDAGGFRESKAQELKSLAAEQRQRVIDSGGKPSYIKALGPSERKIIHTHLAELGDVTSESIGRGTFKRIRVRIKDDSPFKRAQPEGESTDTAAEASPAPARMDRGGRRQGHGEGGRGGQRGGGGGRGPRGRNGSGGGRFRGGDAPRFNRDGTVDDNVGNRLAPGERPMYGTAVEPVVEMEVGDSSDDNRGNR